MTQVQEQRAALAAKRVMPADGARLLPFPAQLRVAQPVDWHGSLRYQLEGIASTVEQSYRMFDMFGEYEEVIDRAAFNETLSADPDVAFLVNHKGVTMARSRTNAAGHRSLELDMVATGLRSKAWVNPHRQDVTDLVHAVQDGDVTEMSFAFRIDDGEWDEDFSHFRIRKVDIDRGDVSAVNYGANPYTSIAARSSELLRDLDRLPVGAARAALDRLQERAELKPAIIDLAAQTTDPIRGGMTGSPVGMAIAAREQALAAEIATLKADLAARSAPQTSSGGNGPVLPDSPLLPPVKGLKEDERSDRGRSIYLARIEWQMHGEWDCED